MDTLQANQLIQQMQNWGIIFDKGLSAEEIENIQAENGFQFPEDLRTLLQIALPIWEPGYDTGGLHVVENFPNWRTHASIIIKKSRRYLFEGIRDVIKFGYEVRQVQGYWLTSWGLRPTDLSEALMIFEQKFASAPLLIPVYAHRFIPTMPLLPGNPILSVAGVDIIHYGHNLVHYFYHEFAPDKATIPTLTMHPRPIDFWDDFIDGPKFKYPSLPEVDIQDIDLDKYADTETD